MDFGFQAYFQSYLTGLEYPIEFSIDLVIVVFGYPFSLLLSYKYLTGKISLMKLNKNIERNLYLKLSVDDNREEPNKWN